MPFGGMHSSLFTRELSLPEFFALSWELFKKIYPVLTLVGIILLFPIFLLGELYPELPAAVSALITLTEAVATAVFTLGAYCAVHNALHQQETTLGEAFAFGMARLGKALWTLALYVLIVAFLSIFFLVPGVIWGVYYNFALFVVAQDGIWGYPALKKSKRLIRGRWWRVFSFTAFAFVVSAGLIVAAAFLFSALHPTPALMLVVDLIGLVFLSFFTVARIVLYVNLRATPRHPEEN